MIQLHSVEIENPKKMETSMKALRFGYTSRPRMVNLLSIQLYQNYLRDSSIGLTSKTSSSSISKSFPGANSGELKVSEG